MLSSYSSIELEYWDLHKYRQPEHFRVEIIVLTLSLFDGEVKYALCQSGETKSAPLSLTYSHTVKAISRQEYILWKKVLLMSYFFLLIPPKD